MSVISEGQAGGHPTSRLPPSSPCICRKHSLPPPQGCSPEGPQDPSKPAGQEAASDQSGLVWGDARGQFRRRRSGTCHRQLPPGHESSSHSVVPSLCDPTDCSPPGSSVHGDSLGKHAGVGCHALLLGIFPTQRPNLGLLHWQLGSLLSEPSGKPRHRKVSINLSKMLAPLCRQAAQ